MSDGKTAMVRKALTASGLVLVMLAVIVAVKPAWGADGLKWVGCGISKKAFMGALAAAYEKKTGVKISLEGGGATRGIVDVASGKADMGGTCRHVLPRTEERGVKLVPVGWDALVVIVNPSNSVNNLTMAQLKDIFTGKITNWKEVGGRDRKILVVVRKGKISGVGRMFRELAFKNPEQDFTKNADVEKESSNVEKTVETDPAAIAVSGVSSAHKRAVKMLMINGKAPVRENIADGSYLLYRPLYLVTKVNAPEAVAKFIAFAQSEEGQSVISGEGTVNLKEGARLWAVYGREMKDAGVMPGTF
jgi:phosphate transport system substrate-binding protein